MQSNNTFTAAVMTEVGQPLKLINNILMPKPNRGQVLVKINYAGLCHSQLMEVQGLRGKDNYLPHMLGHEGVGVVMEIGGAVTKVQPGDKVIISWIKSDGIDAGGYQYKTMDGLSINAGAATAFSEYALVSENRVVLKPSSTPERLSVLYGCAVPTGFGMVINNIPKNAEGTIAFIGLGGIGLSALLAAPLYDFKKIIAIDINPEKLVIAEELGATHIINSSELNLVDIVKKITNDIGVDYAFESAGKTQTIELAYSLVRKNGGLCIFASHPPFGEKIHLDPFDLICGKNIKGTWGGEAKPDVDIKRFDDFYLKGQLPLERLVSNEYRLSDINVAIDDLQKKKIIRALINCSSERI